MRVLTYSHDGCGLGHLKRMFVIGRHITRCVPEASVLSIVGSTVAHEYFDSASASHDYVKLPSVRKTGAGEYEPRHLRMPYGGIIEMRSSIIDGALAAFDPDVVIVDRHPGGLDGEMRHGLKAMRARRPDAQIVLGLRDILDDPEPTKVEWSDPRRIDWMERIFDAVWIWGERNIFDAVESYDFPDSIRRMTRFFGYLPLDACKIDKALIRARGGVDAADEKMLLLAAGGGGDALAAFLEALRGLERIDSDNLRSVVVSGPLMSESDFCRLRNAVERHPRRDRISLKRFVKPFADWLRAADAVICMGGYNTMREVAALGRPALALPRRHPRREQALRAELFAEHGWCECAEVGRGAADAVAHFCTRLLDGDLLPSRPALQCRGLVSLGAEAELMCEAYGEHGARGFSDKVRAAGGMS